MDKILPIVVMILIGVVVAAGLSYVIPGGLGYIYNQNLKLLEACEKELPRNQKCKLIAVPEEPT